MLQPYFNRLQQWNERVPGASRDLPATVLIGTQRLAVDPWERSVISAWSGLQDSPEQTPLPLEVLACVAKTFTDTERLRIGRDQSRDELYRLQAEIMLDSAIGTALLRETRRLVDESVAAGAHREARQWVSLQRRLRQAVSQAILRLAESERDRVQTLADTLTDVPAEPPEEESTSGILGRLERNIEKRSAKRIDPNPVDIESPDRERPAPALRRLPSRTATLAVAFAISFLRWAGVSWVPRQFTDVPAELSLSDLGQAGPFADLVTRHPSLYLEIDGGTWSAMSRQQRWQAVKAVSEVASPLGYQGILVRSETDRPLAQWLRGRGIRLLGESGMTPGEGEF